MDHVPKPVTGGRDIALGVGGAWLAVLIDRVARDGAAGEH